ncbi:MAG: glycosyltransferase family 39 protein, partial [Candidatus Omnitrophica bacterium]|nr:glycosyltransferase family 39 protein [Candidatus Omnitrophota bacterium]
MLLRRVCGSLETLSAGEGTLFSLALGLAALSLFMLGLGLLGLVTKLHALALLGFFLVLPWWLEKGKRFSFSWASGASIPFLLMLFAFFLSWLNTTLPPIGNDALAYHLADPKDFILHGRVHPIPLSRESLWPYQTEMLFMLGLLLQGTSLAQALHWVFYPLTAFSIYAFGARFLGRREAVFGALVFVFTPVVFALSGEAYVDLGLTFFIFLSFYAFLLKDTLGELKASLVSGLFCGAALATKYSGLNAAVILTVFWLWRKPVSLKSALYFILSALAVSGVWYLRSYWILGNPVYPFFSNFFGGRGFEFGIQSSLGTGNGVDSFLLLLWDMTFYPKLFGGDVL